MTMAHQAEYQPTLNKGEIAVPEPTILNTEDIIIPGYDEFDPSQAARSIVGLEEASQEVEAKERSTLDYMFDEYVEILKNPASEYQYATGEKTVKSFPVDENGKVTVLDEQPIYRTISKRDILDTKREELELYTKGSLPEFVSYPDSGLPIEEWNEAKSDYEQLVAETVNESIQAALGRAGYPPHLAFELSHDIDEETQVFIDVLKHSHGLGAVAINSIQKTVPLMSGAIDLVARTREKTAKQLKNKKKK